MLCVFLRGLWLEGRKESSLPSCLVKAVSAQKTLQKKVKIAPLLKASKLSKGAVHNARVRDSANDILGAL